MAARAARKTRQKAAKTAPKAAARKPVKAAARRPLKAAAARKPRKAAGARKAPAKRAGGAADDAQPSNGGPSLRSVTPHLVVDGAERAIHWYENVFGAKEVSRMPLPNGKLMHAMVQVGDSAIMMADPFAGPVPEKMMGVTLHLQRKDVDDVWKRAMDNGAQPIMPLADQFWGDRYGQFRDPFGHAWSIGWPAKMTEQQKEKLRDEAMRQMAGGMPHPA